MKDIIRDLYRGNYAAIERHLNPNCAHINALARVVKLEEKMVEMLQPNQYDLYKQYSEAVAELGSISCEDEFVAGYKLGVRMMLSAFPDEYQQLPLALRFDDE